MMKNVSRILTLTLTLTLTLFLTLSCSAQHPTYRKRNYHGYGRHGFHYKAMASLAIGSETVIAFPPKVSLHAYFPRQEVVYGGVDACLGTFGFSSTFGATAGVKLNYVIMEHSFSRTSVFQSHAPNKIWLSSNPKIGVEVQNFILKLGPSFILKEYNGRHDILDKMQVAGCNFNIEIGYIFDSN